MEGQPGPPAPVLRRTIVTTPIRLAVLVGSTREGRFGPTVARWFADQAAARDDIELSVIDLIDHPVPDRNSPRPSVPSTPWSW